MNSRALDRKRASELLGRFGSAPLRDTYAATSLSLKGRARPPRFQIFAESLSEKYSVALGNQLLLFRRPCNPPPSTPQKNISVVSSPSGLLRHVLARSFVCAPALRLIIPVTPFQPEWRPTEIVEARSVKFEYSLTMSASVRKCEATPRPNFPRAIPPPSELP